MDDSSWELAIESEEKTGAFPFTAEELSESSPVFQLHNKYLVLPHQEGLLLINQNLAHQRILYEEILKSITVSRASSQQLLLPLEMDFSKEEIRLLAEIKEELEFSGFVFATFDAENVLLDGDEQERRAARSETPRIADRTLGGAPMIKRPRNAF